MRRTALNHSDGEAERFYRELQQRGASVRVGREATGHSRWFERLLAELGFDVWIADAAEIKRQRVRKQKTGREDARLMRKLLLENRFPRILRQARCEHPACRARADGEVVIHLQFFRHLLGTADDYSIARIASVILNWKVVARRVTALLASSCLPRGFTGNISVR